MRPILAAAILATATPCAAQELTPGTVTVEPLPEAAASPPARQAFVDAAAEALGAAGFTPLPGQGGARWTARLTLTRTPKGSVAATGTAGRRPDVAVGDWGASAIIALPSNKTELRALIVTELAIALVPRGADKAAWTGRALTAQAEGTKADAPARIAVRLAEAAVRGFPRVQETVASVP